MTIEVEINRTQLGRVLGLFGRKKVDAVVRAVGKETLVAGGMLLQAIQENIRIQGLVDTGEYINSWEVAVHVADRSVSARTYHPAAHRLEYGFAGADSLGRIYANPARPHVRPAMAMIRPKIIGRVQVAVVKELSR